MEGNEDLNTTQWAAVVVLLLVLLVPVAVALAAWCKRRYAQAVVRLQAAVASVDAALPETPLPVGGPQPAPLRIVRLPAQDVPMPVGVDPAAPARRLRRRVLCVQFLAGLAYWWLLLLIMLFALLLWQQAAGESGGDGAEVGDAAVHALLWPLLVWPAAMGLLFQAGLREGWIWAAALLAALLFGAGLGGAGIGLSAGLGTGLVWLLLAALLASFLRPAVRGAGPPLVVAFTFGLLVFMLLAFLMAALEGQSDDAPLTLSEGLWGAAALGLLFAVSAWVAWRMLLRLSRRYRAKRFSEMQLALGAYWGLVTAFTAGGVLLLSFEERTGASMEWMGLAVLIAWWCWRLMQRLALRWARRDAAPPLGPLLMLRVFKPSQRSEAFTDRFLARWRFAAPVWMIAGPDLAGAYMEPDEFFAFLGRRLRELFIADDAELLPRIDALDAGRDPDGRFRVSELYCSNSTWKPAVLALMDRAGVVLLDLREYSALRAGTRFELQQLLQRVPLHKVVLIVGADDDGAALEQEIQQAWAQGTGGAAVASSKPAVLPLLQVRDGSRAEMKGLFRAAAAAAAAPR